VGNIFTTSSRFPYRAALSETFSSASCVNVAPIAVQLRGVGHSFTAAANGMPPCAYLVVLFDALSAVAVGHNPDALSPVWGSDADSRNNKWPPSVAKGSQVRKHIVEAHADVASNVLSNDPRGPEFVHEPTHFWPEVTVIFLASALPGEAKWLARVSAANNVDCSNVRPFQLPHVLMDRHARPVLREHATGKRLDLAEGHRLEAARALQAEAEAADAAEQVEHLQHAT
jgi:hypothetical protein